MEIVALTPVQLSSWLNDTTRLERELRCSYRGEPLQGVFREIVAGQLAAAEEDCDHYMWHTFWLVIFKVDRVAIGSAVFKNAPDANGEVEIGYGLGEGYRRYGYMTETVKALCGWALGRSGIKHVIAETDPDGFASQRVLRRCGFKEYSRGSTIWWRL